MPRGAEHAVSQQGRQSSLSFRLHDFELARIDVVETDRQIKAAVADGTVKPSDMKL